ncbi:hypothetical protein KKE06_05285 [Candidatus Micrarchaeota archaeon]|nr:hypothetical protein [Candidatus Micrarchaeota archaeon]MBU1929953.1 hypothetical protein [Candidatus Micrarchaeota archaeon]
MEKEAFLRERFRQYYAAHPVQEPPAIEKREFGVGVFGQKISQRHLFFPTFKELNGFLQAQTPFFISYSAAYYQSPSARPMASKHWEGADLIFEFDADDLKTECKQKHDSWHCPECKKSGKGNPSACSNCGSGVKVEEWVCPDCLNAVKKQVFELVDLLETDLGFSKAISINFSGSKGFHVHVRSAKAQALSPHARIEVLDFLTGQGLDLKRLGFVEKNKSLYGPSFVHAKGWQKRILHGLLDLIEQNDASALAVAGNVSIRTTKKALEKKESIVKSIQKGVFPSWVCSKSRAFWSSTLDFVSDELKLDIDRQTSLDKFKIVRVPETLHGKTGLNAANVSFTALSDFDGLSDTVVFGKKPVKIELLAPTPRFFLKGQWWGPFKAETLELPEFAAIFLLCRNAAQLSIPKNA